MSEIIFGKNMLFTFLFELCWWSYFLKKESTKQIFSRPYRLPLVTQFNVKFRKVTHSCISHRVLTLLHLAPCIKSVHKKYSKFRSISVEHFVECKHLILDKILDAFHENLTQYEVKNWAVYICMGVDIEQFLGRF